MVKRDHQSADFIGMTTPDEPKRLDRKVTHQNRSNDITVPFKLIVTSSLHFDSNSRFSLGVSNVCMDYTISDMFINFLAEVEIFRIVPIKM